MARDQQAAAGREDPEHVCIYLWVSAAVVWSAVSTSSETQRRKNRARKGKWSPRVTEMIVLTYPCPTASRALVAARECARVTGEAGEDGQNSGNGAARSSWTRPSVP